MYSNPLRELMDRLGVTREEMGALLGLKTEAVGKLLYQLDPSKARVCLDIIQSRGYTDLVDHFSLLAGIPMNRKFDLTDLTPSEAKYLQQCLTIHRNPDTAIAKLILLVIADEASKSKTD